jgi:hypothetical protein
MIPDDFENEQEDSTELPGLTAAMEVAGVESIPGAKPDKIVLGFSRED